MKRSSLTAPVLSRLLELDEQMQFLSRKIDDTERAIANARVRLTGGFQEQEEPNDLRKALDEMVADLPVMERRCVRTRHTVSRCKDFLDKLSDDAVLETVMVNVNGHDLGPVQVRLKAAENELKVLREVPTPSTDIGQRIKCYCTEMARPKIYGIDKQGGKLEVIWPENNLLSMLALFHGDAMAAALKAEVERMSNDPMPPEARRERIAELKREIDGLQRLAFALGADASDLPARVVLGVRVTHPKPVEHRETAA
jgi:hypothetical protein